MVVVVDVPEAVNNHGIHGFPVAHAHAVAAAAQQVAAGAHIFLAASDDDGAVASLDGLRREDDALQARAAHGVVGHGGHFLGDTGAQQRLACRVLADARAQHLTHDDFAHLRRVNLGALEHLGDDDAAQLGCGHVGE